MESHKMSNRLASREVEGSVSSKGRDEAQLARLGKRSVLKVLCNILFQDS